MSVRAAWGIFLWFFPLQFVQNLSKEQNPLQPCSLRTNSIPFSITSFLVCLIKWEKRGKSHMRIDPNCHHLTFGGKNREKLLGNFQIFNNGFYLPFPKSLCLLYCLSLCAKNSLREGPKAGIPGKYFTLFILAPPLSLQLSFHHWVHHPEHNQCLKHLKTGLSQPRKRTGFNVCRSTKALSPEHLTY